MPPFTITEPPLLPPDPADIEKSPPRDPAELSPAAKRICDAEEDIEDPDINEIDPAASPRVSPVEIETPPETPSTESPVLTETEPLDDDDDTGAVIRLIAPDEPDSLSPDENKIDPPV